MADSSTGHFKMWLNSIVKMCKLSLRYAAVEKDLSCNCKKHSIKQQKVFVFQKISSVISAQIVSVFLGSLQVMVSHYVWVSITLSQTCMSIVLNTSLLSHTSRLKIGYWAIRAADLIVSCYTRETKLWLLSNSSVHHIISKHRYPSNFRSAFQVA